MKTGLVLATLCILVAPAVLTANAQDKPQNTISQIEKDRKDDHTVRQVTPDPKKSPGKHADNLSKNVNHEMNRSSKHVNRTARKDSHALSHARHTDHTVRQVTVSPNKSPGKHADNLSKNVNHDMNRNSKHVNTTIKKDAHSLSNERHTDHTVRQVTPSPNKSPGKHADNLSKNVNHETNRISKDVNHLFSGKKKTDDKKSN